MRVRISVLKEAAHVFVRLTTCALAVCARALHWASASRWPPSCPCHSSLDLRQVLHLLVDPTGCTHGSSPHPSPSPKAQSLRSSACRSHIRSLQEAGRPLWYAGHCQVRDVLDDLDACLLTAVSRDHAHQHRPLVPLEQLKKRLRGRPMSL